MPFRPPHRAARADPVSARISSLVAPARNRATRASSNARVSAKSGEVSGRAAAASALHSRPMAE